MTAAATLPGRARTAVLDAGRAAFGAGLTAAASVGAVLFALLAVVATRTLRHVPAHTAPPAQQAEPAPVAVS